MWWRAGLSNLGQQALIVGLRGAVEVFLSQWPLSVKSATRKTRQSRSWTQTGRGSGWQPMKTQGQGFGVRVAKMQHVPQTRDDHRVARDLGYSETCGMFGTDLWLDGAGEGGRLTKLGMLVAAPASRPAVTPAPPAPSSTLACDGERIVMAALPRRSQSSTSISSSSDERLVSLRACM